MMPSPISLLVPLDAAMDRLPPSVAAQLAALAYENRPVAYLQLAQDLSLLCAGGDLAAHGLDDVATSASVLERAPFLVGLLPLDGPACTLPCMELVSGRAADVHIFAEAYTTWVLLIDATTERASAQRMQQKAYDMTLMEERQAELNRQLAITNAALTEAQRNLERAHEAIRDELRRKQRELAEARSLQLSLVPPSSNFPMGSRAFSIDVVLEPAREVGGDLADYFWLDSDVLVLVIGDVSGKGAGAALMMARTHALFRALAARPDARRLYECPERATEIVNEALAAGNPSCTFVTLLLAVLDATSGRMSYVRAGHVPPFLRRGDGNVETLSDPGGLPLGMMEGSPYMASTVELAPGDGLLILTDGITEAFAPASELFGDDRVVHILRSSENRGEALLLELLAAVKAFEAGSPPGDDKGLILLELHDVATH